MCDMSCEQCVLYMMDALDGILTAPDYQQLITHLETCSRCCAEWYALHAIEELLANMPLLSPAPGFVGQVISRLDCLEARQHS